MDAATFWTAIGSVATAVGSLLTLFALLATVILYSKQRNDERAAQIREDIRSFVSATARLVRVLRDGSPLISAAWAAREIIRESFPSDSDVDNVREVLGNGSIGLSVAVVSWDRSSDAEALRSILDDLLATSRRMTGDLNILSTAGAMLLAIADDMKMTFLRLLTDQRLVMMFLEENLGTRDVDKLLIALAQQLHGNTAMYFDARYSDAIRWLDELVSETAVAVGELDTAKLLAVARAKAVIPADTRTAEMRVHLSGLERHIPTAAATRIRERIAKVEKAISKDSASKHLEERKAGDLSDVQKGEKGTF